MKKINDLKHISKEMSHGPTDEYPNNENDSKDQINFNDLNKSIFFC